MKDFMQYERPSVTADVVVLRLVKEYVEGRKEDKKKLQVLLVKRSEEPYIGRLALPGGFVNIDKTIENTARQKTLEKTGWKVDFLEQLYTFDAIERDNRWRVITTSYIGVVKERVQKEQEGTEYSAWFDVKDGHLINSVGNILEYDDLAFDHGEIIKKALERIRNKIFYSDIGFEFMDDEFTVRELQVAFEVLYGKKIDNFKRTMNDRITETGGIYSGKACRPAKLYKKA